MADFKEMDFDAWVEMYKPIKNHLDDNASFGGLMFETYGDELEEVRFYDPRCIWTYGDGDDAGSYIWNGYHFVNRLGYFLTEVPAPSEEECIIQIQVSVPWFYCGNCDSEFEDIDNHIRDTFQDNFDEERCPKCATAEELELVKDKQCTWCKRYNLDTEADFNLKDVCNECVENGESE